MLYCTPDALLHGREPGEGGRVFPNQIIKTDNNTVENCLNQCAKFGYPAGGMEFSSECCERRILAGSVSPLTSAPS